jgi:hypothetical protein
MIIFSIFCSTILIGYWLGQALPRKSALKKEEIVTNPRLSAPLDLVPRRKRDIMKELEGARALNRDGSFMTDVQQAARAAKFDAEIFGDEDFAASAAAFGSASLAVPLVSEHHIEPTLAVVPDLEPVPEHHIEHSTHFEHHIEHSTHFDPPSDTSNSFDSAVDSGSSTYDSFTPSDSGGGFDGSSSGGD